MALLLWTSIFCIFAITAHTQVSTTFQTPTGDISTASVKGNESVTDVKELNTTTEIAAPSVPKTTGAGPQSASTGETVKVDTTTNATEATLTVSPSKTTTRTTIHSTAITTTTVPSTKSLPLSGALPPPITNLSLLCPCNTMDNQCDVNCCCDLDCAGDLALFTSCTVQKVIADPQLCSQQAVLYSLNTTADGFAQVQSTAMEEVNPNVFCIQTANYMAALEFATPEVPTEGNFDSLFQKFVGFFFSSSSGRETDVVSSRANAQTASGYLYADVIQTVDKDGIQGFLTLPAPSVTSQCTDANPAAFLESQKTQCIRNLDLATDCANVPALSPHNYLQDRILSMKNNGSELVNIWVSSVTLQSLNGTRIRLNSTDITAYSPGWDKNSVCSNVVLKVIYEIEYHETGAIVNAKVAFTLGAVDRDMLPLQQDFQIIFTQASTHPVPLSGNPGYVFGLPLVAGWRPAGSGIYQSANRFGGLTVLKSSGIQDCLNSSGERSPVLFGVNVVSGCTLRVDSSDNCTVLSEVILGVLRGQSFPQYVASFGNSQPQEVLDWVPIKTVSSVLSAPSCSVPLSVHLEVRWTLYGSLVNPQAQIVNVTERISANSSNLQALAEPSGLLGLSSTVTFIAVSAPAQPEYKAPPTIDASLPFDFFFPFV